jgi:hypothetical protein
MSVPNHAVTVMINNMTPAQVQRRLKTIQRNQIKWDSAERDLQNLCAHPNASKKYRGDTGNWDRTQDSYWIEHRCPDCGKFWSVEQ